MTYAYKVIEGVVVDGIVGDADWAIQNLGGFWVPSDELQHIGGLWNDINGFQPPIPPVVE